MSEQTINMTVLQAAVIRKPGNYLLDPEDEVRLTLQTVCGPVTVILDRLGPGVGEEIVAGWGLKAVVVDR